MAPENKSTYGVRDKEKASTSMFINTYINVITDGWIHCLPAYGREHIVAESAAPHGCWCQPNIDFICKNVIVHNPDH